MILSREENTVEFKIFFSMSFSALKPNHDMFKESL